MADTPPATQQGPANPPPSKAQGRPNFPSKGNRKTNKPRKPKDPPQQAVNPIKLPANMASGLAPPSLKKANDESKNKLVTNESLVAESVFAVDSGFIPRKREIEFHPSSSGWSDTINDAYAEFRNDSKVQVAKELPIEAFRYYASSMYWLRTISLKLWLGQELTPAEAEVQRTFEGKTFVLPDPIHLGLKAIGRVTTKNGEVLAPTFPSLPVTVTKGIPGTCGEVTTANHNYYEDYPIIGISYQGCVERCQTATAHSYESVVTPAGTTANKNMQGFDSLKPVRQDSLAILYSMGFEEGVKPRTVANSGLNYNALKVVSNVLAKAETFKNAEVDIFSIPSTGSLAQIIETIPDVTAIEEI